VLKRLFRVRTRLELTTEVYSASHGQEVSAACRSMFGESRPRARDHQARGTAQHQAGVQADSCGCAFHL